MQYSTRNGLPKRRDFAIPPGWRWLISRVASGHRRWELVDDESRLLAATIYVSVSHGFELVLHDGSGNTPWVLCGSLSQAMGLAINHLVVGLAWAPNDEDRPRRRTLPAEVSADWYQHAPPHE